MAEDLDSGSFIGEHKQCIADELICNGSARTSLSKCGSSDALAIYEHTSDDGVVWYDAHCYSCEQTFSKAELYSSSLADELGVNKETNSVEKKKKFSLAAKQSPMTKDEIVKLIKEIGYKGNDYRGIKDEYNKFYGHLTQLAHDGKVMARYYPETVDGKIVGYKCRNHPKDFRYGKVGQTGVASDLSGQAKFNSGGKYVLLVGGEEDKVAAYQMLRDYQVSKHQEDFAPVAVVSPTSGEGSAVKQVSAQYEWFDTFDIIIIGMDNDEVGNKVSKEVAEILPKDKVKIARWTKKDPNEMLQLNMSRQFLRDFYSARDYVEDTVKTSIVADSEMEVELGRLKIPLPPFMKELEYVMAGGIPLGYWVNLGAQTGGGKTTFVNEMVYYWIFNSPHKIGILSLELNAGQYQTVLLSRHIGKKIQLIEDPSEAVKFVQQEWVQEKRRELRETELGEQRYTLLDDRDGSLESVQLQIDKLVKKYGCKMIVIDPINDLFEGVGLEEQTAFIKYLKGVIKGGVSLFCICHITKGRTNLDKDGNRVMRQLTEDDFAGVTNIIKSGGCNILTSRDKLAETEKERNTTIVETTKCRWTGRGGNSGKWYYDNDTHTMHDFNTFFNAKRA